MRTDRGCAAEKRQHGQSGKTRLRQKARPQNEGCRDFCGSSRGFEAEDCGLCRRGLTDVQPRCHSDSCIGEKVGFVTSATACYFLQSLLQSPSAKPPREVWPLTSGHVRHSQVPATAAAQSNRTFARTCPNFVVAAFDKRKPEVLDVSGNSP